jgi:hypothetical protein
MHLIWNKKYLKIKYMPNFCTLSVYLHLDNIPQASLKKYCIGKQIWLQAFKWFLVQK